VPLKESESYFTHAKVLVSTSSSEGFPNVFLQACAAKTPILSLKVDPDGFIKNQKCGLVCDDNYVELKAGLEKFFQDKEFYQVVSENCFNYLKANHSLEKNILSWKELLNNL
jgi:glycosyltransferase involved in cell wall biosynthesis